MHMAVKASCLCNSIQIEISPPFRQATDCHCQMCRKAHGSAYATYLSFRRENLNIVEGTSLITSYQSSETVKRSFCEKCGSNLFFDREGSPWIGIAMGILDDDPGIRPEAHIFYDFKAPWSEIPDTLPKFSSKADRDGQG